MKGKERGIFKFINMYNKIPRGFFMLGNLAVGLMLIVVFVNVILRYGFSKPFYWAEEVTGMMLVCLTFSVAADVLRRKHHITCDILYRIFPQKVQHGIDTFVHICMVVFASLLGWQGLESAVMAYKINLKVPSLLGTPLLLPYSFIFVGFVLLALQSLIEIIERRRDI